MFLRIVSRWLIRLSWRSLRGCRQASLGRNSCREGCSCPHEQQGQRPSDQGAQGKLLHVITGFVANCHFLGKVRYCLQGGDCRISRTGKGISKGHLEQYGKIKRSWVKVQATLTVGANYRVRLNNSRGRPSEHPHSGRPTEYHVVVSHYVHRVDESHDIDQDKDKELGVSATNTTVLCSLRDQHCAGVGTITDIDLDDNNLAGA